MKNAPKLNPKNFHALTRLDENRAKCQVHTLPCYPTPHDLGPEVYRRNDSGVCSEAISIEFALSFFFMIHITNYYYYSYYYYYFYYYFYYSAIIVNGMWNSITCGSYIRWG